MILQALHRLAEREGLAPDLDFEPKGVGYLVHVDESGRMLGPPQSTYSAPAAEEGAKRKPVARPKTFLVPREKGRTSGDRAFFFVDKAEYVFGLDPAGGWPAEKLAARSALFRERVAACAEATGDAGAVAVARFLDAVAAGTAQVELPPDVKPNDLFAFVLGGEERLVTDRPAVRRYYKELRRAEAADPVQCLVTGELAPAAELHTQVKYVPGASSAGVALVSFNASAFESYGWTSNDNAPVSRDAAETYGAALQRLLHPQPPDPRNPGTESLPRRNVRLSDDTVVCYWSADESGEEVASLIGLLFEGTDVEQVGELYRSIWHGRVPEIADPSAFYALTLTGAQGRVAIRSWLETTVADAAANLARFVADLEVARSTPPRKGGDAPPPLSLRERLRALAPPGKSVVSAPLAAQAVDCALRGDGFPLSFLTRAVQRYRAELSDDQYADRLRRDAQAGWIRGVLARRLRSTDHDPQEIPSAMDTGCERPGYLLGRALALMERLQQVAMGDLNASVVDKFFSAASATPRAVFPRLDKNARHHARKARDEEKSKRYAAWLERQIAEIYSHFDVAVGGFPASLSPEEQGLFVLGFHQQRHALRRGRRDDAGNDDSSPAASAEPGSTDDLQEGTA